jgi:hypothetical protein
MRAKDGHTRTVEKIKMALSSICGVTSVLRGGGGVKRGVWGRWIKREYLEWVWGDKTHWRERGDLKRERWRLESLIKAQHRIPLIVQNDYKSAQMKNRIIKRLWKYKHQRKDLVFFPTDEKG